MALVPSQKGVLPSVGEAQEPQGISPPIARLAPSIKLIHQVPIVRIPKPDTFRIVRRKCSPIGREHQAVCPILIDLKSDARLSRCDVPQPDLAVYACRCQK